MESGFDAGAGDFVYIPAGEIHVEANASDTEPLVVVVTRNCPDSHVVYLDGGPDGALDVPAPLLRPGYAVAPPTPRRVRAQRAARGGLRQ